MCAFLFKQRHSDRQGHVDIITVHSLCTLTRNQYVNSMFMLSCFVYKDGDVKIVWSSGHEGHVNLDWLRRHCYSHHSLEERRKECLPEVQKQVVTD